MSLLQRRLKERRQQQMNTDEKAPVTTSKSDIWQQVKERVMKEVVENIDTEALDQMSDGERSKYLTEQVSDLVEQAQQERKYFFSRSEYHRMVGELVSEIIGYGPITDLLEDPTVNEIMVNGPNQVYVERRGKLELTDITFRDDNHVTHIIERIVAPLGKRVDESSPMVDARLPNGSRINATIPPVSIDGPVLTIRKFSQTPYTMSDLINFGTISTDMAVFIKACVEGRLNIMVGGGTASGKTTTLNVLSSFIPETERIITIEDAAELHLMQQHVIRMESRPANIEGRGRIPIRDLVINSLRMRPDRIVVGEVRGGEALDMMQAMNTGHEGSITTGHANSPRDLLARLETMVLMAGVDLPLKAIREQIASAIDIIVFQSRLRDGSRKITNVTEVVGMEGNVITLQDIFVYNQQGFRTTGVLPKCLQKLKEKGYQVPTNIFS